MPLELNHKIAVYVPSTMSIDKPDNTAQLAMIDRIARDLSAKFGGATAESVTGYWVSDTAGLVKESPVRVWAYADNGYGLKDYAIALAERVKSEMSQDAVLCEVDSVGILV